MEARGEATINSVNGLHARPLAQVVKKAKEFESDITFSINEKNASAKSLLHLQTLNMVHGDVIKIFANGTDASVAVNELVELIESIKE